MFSAASVCLPDCVFACLFVNTITSERLDALYKNIALVRMSRSKVKVTGDKKRKSAALFRERPRGRGYAGGKISACCLLNGYGYNLRPNKYLSLVIVFSLEALGGDVRCAEDLVVDDMVSHTQELVHVLFARLVAVVCNVQDFLAHRLEFVDSSRSS